MTGKNMSHNAFNTIKHTVGSPVGPNGGIANRVLTLIFQSKLGLGSFVETNLVDKCCLVGRPHFLTLEADLQESFQPWFNINDLLVVWPF